jgi:phosphatidylinositol glycan class B
MTFAGVRGVFGICLLALILRLTMFQMHPSIVFPDEIYQYLEQAHRLVFGTGIIPWEYMVGARNWVLPALLTPPLFLARAIDATPRLQAWLVTLLMAVLSLAPVICAYRWGMRIAGWSGALLAAGLNAIWFEAIYYSIHPLADTFGAALLVVTLYLLDTDKPSAKTRLFWAGASAALMFAVRFQLVPALALAVVLYCGRQWNHRWRPLLTGGVLALVAIEMLDDITLGTPFQSIWMNIYFNTVLHVADDFGVSSWHFYLDGLRQDWGPAWPLLLVTIAAGAMRLKPLAIAAAVLLTFSAISHKEMRFIYPAIPLMLTLAGIGTAALLQRISSRPAAPALLAMAMWCLISAALVSRDSFAAQLHTSEGMVRATRAVAEDDKTCGLAIAPANAFWLSGGYTQMRRGMPLYNFEPASADATPQMAAFNAIIAPQTLHFPNSGFDLAACWDNGNPPKLAGTICLWRRPGACNHSAGAKILLPGG